MRHEDEYPYRLRKGGNELAVVEARSLLNGGEPDSFWTVASPVASAAVINIT